MEHLSLRLRIYLSLLVGVMVLGTIGFMRLEELSLGDALYFSFVTVATVGYGDIVPHTPMGKTLAILLMVMGVGTFLGVIANATEIVLQKREKAIRLEKMNMIIGLFFSEVGTGLLDIFIRCDPALENIRQDLIITADWSDLDFIRVGKRLKGYHHSVALEKLDLTELRAFLSEKRDFMVRLLENPILLEHAVFTSLLRAVFHLAEELAFRKGITWQPEADMQHLAGDIQRGYNLLVYQWLIYMNHLKNNFPFLFSLAVRTNPFDRQSSVVVE